MSQSPTSFNGGIVSRLHHPISTQGSKKAAKQVREAVLEASRTLEREPYAGEQLTGSLHMLYSFHFTAGQPQYWIAYTLDHPHQLSSCISSIAAKISTRN